VSSPPQARRKANETPRGTHVLRDLDLKLDLYGLNMIWL